MSILPSASPTYFRAALVTNARYVHIVDHEFSTTILDGHSDIVLSVDVSPDGLVVDRCGFN